MARTSDALHATRHGGAPWSYPTALPSVTLVYKRDTFNCTPTCTPQVAAHALSMHASWLVGCYCRAMMDGQYERCAACHAAWRRCTAVPDRRTIGGPRLQAWSRQPPDERAALYRVRGDVEMDLKLPEKAAEDYGTAITLLEGPGGEKAEESELPAA